MSDGAAPSGSGDAGLVERARSGDRDAFELLVRRHLKAAHAMARRMTGDPHDAEDVCQEAFVRALERIEQCRRPEAFRGWLLTIIRNTALNLGERERLRSAEPLEGSPEAAAVTSPVRGPARDFEAAELRGRLREGLERLTETQRKVLLLHDYEGWTHAEIGAELGVAPGTSRYHLYAARGEMRSTLGDLDTRDRNER